MTTLEGIFGPISGRLGDCVFRNKGGENNNCSTTKKANESEECIRDRERKKIGLTGKIAKSIAGNRHYVLIGVQVTSYYTISF